MDERILELLAISAYQAYLNCIVGNPAPIVRAYYERMKAPQANDLVLEVTSRNKADIKDRIGRLISTECDDSQGTVYVIETLDGRTFRWWNARMIVIPDRLFEMRS